MDDWGEPGHNRPTTKQRKRQGLLGADLNLGLTRWRWKSATKRAPDHTVIRIPSPIFPVTYQSQSCRTAAAGVLGGNYIPPQLPPCLHWVKGAPRAPNSSSAPQTRPWRLRTLLVPLSPKGERVRSAAGSPGMDEMLVSWALLSWTAAVDGNVFISLKESSECRREPLTGAGGMAGATALFSAFPSLPLCRQHAEKLTIVGSNHTLVLNAERVGHREPLMSSTI